MRFTARLAAAWFVLALAAGAASPWVRPATVALVCNAAGNSRLLVQTQGGWSEGPSHDTLHCPLCLLAGGGATSTPTDMPGLALPRLLATKSGLTPWFHAIHAARAPLPARGPPPRT